MKKVVGETGFEPATARPPAEYSTRLSYSPTHVPLSNLWDGRTILRRFRRSKPEFIKTGQEMSGSLVQQTANVFKVGKNGAQFIAIN